MIRMNKIFKGLSYHAHSSFNYFTIGILFLIMKREKKLLCGGVFVAFVLIVSIVLFLFYKGEVGDYVQVTIDGKIEGEWRLKENRSIVLNNGSNILTIENGKAKMTSADCPDKICMKEGWISHTGECITCLPNRILVTVYKSDDSVDLVV